MFYLVGCVSDFGEGGCMVFGKVVGVEVFDLIEIVVCELRIVFLVDYVVDYFFFEIVDGFDIVECCYGVL